MLKRFFASSLHQIGFEFSLSVSSKFLFWFFPNCTRFLSWHSEHACSQPLWNLICRDMCHEEVPCISLASVWCEQKGIKAFDKVDSVYIKFVFYVNPTPIICMPSFAHSMRELLFFCIILLHWVWVAFQNELTKPHMLHKCCSKRTSQPDKFLDTIGDRTTEEYRCKLNVQS